MGGAKTQYPQRAEHSIGRRRFRGYGFEVMSDDADVAEYLTTLFDAFETADDGDDLHSVVVLTRGPEEEGLLLIDGDLASSETVPGRISSTVVHVLTRRMIDDSDALGIHAGGVVLGGTAVALPAEMESGKSTLTAGLVRAGFSYLTDEAVLLDWETLSVIPFPKPISLDPGSWALFPELEPNAPLPAGYKDTQWHVPPDAFRTGTVAAPCRIRYVVFPKYTQGVTTQLTPMRRAEATIELAKNTFRFNERPRPSLNALTGVVGEADCFRLDVGDLQAAVASVSDLVEHAR